MCNYGVARTSLWGTKVDSWVLTFLLPKLPKCKRQDEFDDTFDEFFALCWLKTLHIGILQVEKGKKQKNKQKTHNYLQHTFVSYLYHLLASWGVKGKKSSLNFCLSHNYQVFKWSSLQIWLSFLLPHFLIVFVLS